MDDAMDIAQCRHNLLVKLTTHEIAKINFAFYIHCMMTRNTYRERSRLEMCPTEERPITMARFLGALFCWTRSSWPYPQCADGC